MRFTTRNRTQKIGAWLLVLSQLTFAAGCNRGGTASSVRSSQASTAAGSTAGVDMGEILYGVIHHQVAAEGDSIKLAALEARKADLVAAINQILPGSQTSANVQALLPGLIGLFDDGSVEAAAGDVDAIVVDLMSDSVALDGLAKLLAGNGGARAASFESRATNMLISRLLAYPELEDLVRGAMQLVEQNDGVDEQGDPNGERNLLRELQGTLSRALLGFQPSPTAASSVGSSLDALADALLEEQPMRAFNALGAPAWGVRLDVHGNPAVAADPATGQLPAPFVDGDGDGAADVDADGRPVDAAGAPIEIAPFGSDGARDADQRALAPGGALLYQYFDVKRTILSELVLLTGEVLQKDVPAKAVDVLDALVDRVHHSNGTADPSDDYETLTPDSPIIDLAHAQFEVVKRSPIHDLLRGLAAVVKNDKAKFGAMVDDLMVAMKRASQAAHGTPAAGANQAMLNDLLPLLEDAMRPRGRTISAVRSLLQAFNTKQKQLRNLPIGFARMMKYHDYRNRILADATHKSAMQRILEMMERANKCNAVGMGNMAEFYLKAMAGDQKVLGITVHIGTIHFLLQIGFLRNLLCSGIRAEDVNALKDFNDSGALDAMKPICEVFSDRGEIPLLKDIMLGLGAHYEQAMRPTEPLVVSILESGAVEKLFEVIDDMTQVRVPGSNEVVADVLADTLQALVDSSTPVYDRHNRPHSSLAHMLLEPIDALSQRARQRQVEAQLDEVMGDLADVLLQTYTDANGRERWKWQGMGRGMGGILEFLADAIPQDQVDRQRWAAQHQIDIERLLSGRDAVVVIDLLQTIARSPQKDVINRGLANLFTPQPSAQFDVFGAVLVVVAEMLAKKPSAAGVDEQALADVLHFFGRQLDPSLGRVDGIVRLLRGLVAADDNLFLLHVLRNAFDMGPSGTETAPFEVIQSVLSDVSAAGAGGASGPMTAAELRDLLQKVHDFINDAQDGLAAIVNRVKSRSGKPKSKAA